MQLAFADLERVPDAEPDDDFSSACRCADYQCGDSGLPFYHRRGHCQDCPCPASGTPPGAVFWDREITLADGSVVRVDFESEYFDNVPHVDLYGPVSDTGYRSHFGLIGEGREAGETWDAWVLAIAEHHHAEFLRESKKPKRRTKGAS